MIKIEKIKLRTILNSAGKKTFEVEMLESTGVKAYASSPSAILAGKREINTTDKLDDSLINTLTTEICNTWIKNQEMFDTLLNKYINKIGSHICLSLSLAFARIMSQKEHTSLIKYIAKIANYKTTYITPKPLVTIFAGGVHNSKNKGTIQNIMLSINITPFSKALNPILEIYSNIEKQLLKKNYSSSSGMLVDNMTTDEKFEMVLNTIKKLGYDKKVTIAIDVAAEHFFFNNMYLYEEKKLTSDQLEAILIDYKNKYHLTYIEDPFAPNDEKSWKKFKKKNSQIAILGDDLFATQNQYINPELANGIIIKMNQVGTLSGTIKSFMQAKQEKMITCVSQRSLETEDTFMCDLAIALDADYIKIGGPRRGDRIIKYNQLLRLEEEFEQ